MCAENVKRKHSKIAFVTIPVLLLAATVAVSVMVSEDADAKDGRYSGDTSQAAPVNNECLNPIFDSNTINNLVGVGNCGGTVSRQDESGQASAPITSQTANPTIELQRSTTTQPPLTGTPPTIQSCELCFVNLTPTQRSAFEDALSREFHGANTIGQLCEVLVNIINSGRNPTGALENIDEILGQLEDTGQISATTHSAITACLIRLG